MSRKGNPYDNAFCESFMKTLKYDEVHRQEYRDRDRSAGLHRSDFIERVYNQETPSLGARLPPAPANFENGLGRATKTGA